MNLKSMAAAAVASGVVTSIAAGEAVQWRVEDGGNGHWYRFNSSHASWTSARTAAIAQGGDLACITNADENAFVRDLIPAGDAGYLGGIRTPNGQTTPWHWVSGEGWSYANWIPGEPNGSTAGEVVWLERDSGGWNDHTQDWAIQGALLEWSADCNNDGLVDYGQCRDGSLPDFNGNNIPDCCEQAEACVVGAYPVQWRSSDGGNGHWYFTTDQVGNWDSMRALAQSVGGDLGSLASLAENEFVRRILRQGDAASGAGPWIGAAKSTGQPWKWCDGTVWGFVNWAVNEPCCGDPDRFVHLTPSGLWNDHDQSRYPCRGLIEWSTDCNADGLVDYGQILRGELSDANGNWIPDACEAGDCSGDVNADSAVNGDDLAIVLSNWGENPAKGAGDANHDGLVDGADLALVLGSWGPCGG